MQTYRNPRIVAATSYLFPVLPACAVLLRERHNRFVRGHAAQALLFFLTVLAVQLTLFGVVIVLGNVVLVFWVDVVLGLVFDLLLVAVGITALVLWLRCIRDCLAGTGPTLPLIGGWATHLERESRHLLTTTASTPTK